MPACLAPATGPGPGVRGESYGDHAPTMLGGTADSPGPPLFRRDAGAVEIHSHQRGCSSVQSRMSAGTGVTLGNGADRFAGIDCESMREAETRSVG